MSGQNSKKYQEGQSHLNSAEKHLKTGFFKWNPDYDSAIAEFNKAATAFRNAKALEEAASAYMKASKAQRANGSVFHAAKALESAAFQYKELKQLDKASYYINEAATMFLEDGVPETARIALERAAKMIEHEMPNKAIELYMRCCDIGEQEDNIRVWAENMGKVGRLYIRQRKLSEAAKSLSREIELYNQVDNHGLINKLVMGLVLVHLHLGDSIAASKVYHAALSYEGFPDSEEAGPVAGVIEAYENQDQEMASRCVNDPLFRYMENDFTKLARDLRVPGGGQKKETAAAAASFPADQAAAQQPAAAPVEEDDDDEIDLK